MAESPVKRQREEAHIPEVLEEDSKRHKTSSYTQQILSLLEIEEEVPSQNLTSIMSILENEISFDYNFDDDPLFIFSGESDPETQNPILGSESDFTILDDKSSVFSPVTILKDIVDEEDDKESVIRHLLEASDDELGIPGSENRFNDDDDEINGREEILAVCDGLWELEDETANYYTYMQSELFM